MYELIDSGGGEKLERFGDFVLQRPDPQALWPKRDISLWKKPNAIFNEKWQGEIPASWNIKYDDISFIIKPTAFKHTGLFPEHISNWQWLRKMVKKDMEVLNLFAYTGGASIACAQAGGKVVHVDSSQGAVTWAKENATLSGIDNIRFITEDARDFVEREIRRGRKYDGIIMDPPSFGHGSKLWKIEEDLLPLIANCKKLSPNFFLINGYAAGYSAIAYENNLLDLGGKVERGELTIKEKDSERLLPCGIFARWSV